MHEKSKEYSFIGRDIEQGQKPHKPEFVALPVRQPESSGTRLSARELPTKQKKGKEKKK
jgi:hypothetical protein